MIELETVTIEHPDIPGERMIVNKSDFDPAVHKPYKPPAPKPSKLEGGAGEDPNAPKVEGSGAQKPPKAPKPKAEAEK
jgi:hypothetical protein